MARLEDLPPELVANTVASAVVDAVSAGGDTETIVQRALASAKAALGLSSAANLGGAGVGAEGPSRAEGPVRSGGGDGLASGAPAPQPTARYTPPAPHSNGHVAPAALGSGKALGGVHGGGRPLVTEGDVIEAIRSGQSELRVAPGTIVTALARDAARDAGLRLVEG